MNNMKLFTDGVAVFFSNGCPETAMSYRALNRTLEVQKESGGEFHAALASALGEMFSSPCLGKLDNVGPSRYVLIFPDLSMVCLDRLGVFVSNDGSSTFGDNFPYTEEQTEAMMKDPTLNPAMLFMDRLLVCKDGWMCAKTGVGTVSYPAELGKRIFAFRENPMAEAAEALSLATELRKHGFDSQFAMTIIFGKSKKTTDVHSSD